MDPNSFIARAEAQRWIGIAEKLLMGHDLVGSKTFAIRARDSDPRLQAADQILAIADTLLAADKRVVGNNGKHQPDFYEILQLVRFDQDTEHIASQYGRLAVMLNPNQNRFPYSDQAFQLVNEAWAVLSNPMRKSMYDAELDFPQQQQMNTLGFNLEHQHHHQQHNFFSIDQQAFQPRVQQNHQQHNFLFQNPVRSAREQEQLFQNREHEQLFDPQVQPFQITFSRPPPQPQPAAPSQPPLPWPQAQQQHSQPQQQQQQSVEQNAAPVQLPSQVNDNNGVREEETDTETAAKDVDESSTFWTSCPYCFYMYEYPNVYEECTLRCDNCKRAFQAVCIPSPPPIIDGQKEYICCWGYFPVGVSMSHLQKNNGTNKKSNWTPFSPLNAVPTNVQNNSNRNVAPKKNNFVNKGPRVYIDDVTDDIFTGISDPSDDSDSDLEWNSTKKTKGKKMKKSVKSGY